MSYSSQVRLEQFATIALSKSSDGFLFNLADTFTGQTELVADFLQGHFLLSDAKEHLDDLLLAIGQRRKCSINFPRKRLVH